jgi:hypothetical protein
MKNVNEDKFKSSFIKPKKHEKTYKINHIVSENKNKNKKFEELIKNPNIPNQKIKIQKFNQTCILLYLFI